MTEPYLQFRDVSKRFDAVQALSRVSFQVLPGAFHALCGENGAGKSTLMKILSGVIADYEGTIELQGRPVRFQGTQDAEDAGIGIIHQELNLVGDLSVAANIFLGRERTFGFGWLNNSAMEREASSLFERLGCNISPRELVRTLRVGDQQLVEIAKALSRNSRLVIMDEPTSALTESEVARLFRVIRQLRDDGVTIIYISHKMDEVFTNADTITILRDGQVVRTLPRRDTTPHEVTSLMVGRELGQVEFAGGRTPGAETLRLEQVSVPWPGHSRGYRIKDISLNVRRGEVVGVAGLMGAGRTELLEAIFGAGTDPVSGKILLSGHEVRFHHPAEAQAAGVAMVTEDRKRLGLFPQLSVRENISISSLPQLARGGIVSAGLERLATFASIERLRVKTAGPEAPITSLSGGNQQKCIIARWLQTSPQLLLLDDPTRGIDVGAKAELYRLIDELCREGLAILVTSSELPELITLCDRIYVLCEGRLTAELGRDQFQEETIMRAATGSTLASSA